jgi:molecular chaperone DnaJ
VETPCGECRGEGLVAGRREIPVDVPAGVEDGMILRLGGEGEEAPRGGDPGDLQVVVRVEPHPLFHRLADDPADLLVDLPVPMSVALLGGEVEIPTLEGISTVRLDAGTEPGAILHVKGQGLPRLQRSGRGTLHLRVGYDVPSSPGRRLRKAIESLAEAEREETGPARRKFQDLLKEHAKARGRRKD